MRFNIASHSDRGPRLVNEDALSYHAFNEDTIALCVADGVGGNPCGQAAARICAEKFIAYASLSKPNLKQVVERIHSDVKQYGIDNPECSSMASTLSACILTNKHLTGVHIGDTRVLVLRGNGIRQLTHDHTEVARLIREKRLSQENVKFYPRRNVLEMAIGSSLPLKPFLFNFELEPGDRILLTSDGVHNTLGKSMLRDISSSSKDFNTFTERLIEQLHMYRLKDNVTFLAVQVNY